jgi:phage tail-like protein
MPDKQQVDTFYQTVNFHFRVSFKPSDRESVDTRFQSVTGLDSTLETETVKEGGENRFEHVMPVRRKYGPLTLKRGMLTPSSYVTDWLKKAFDDEKVEPIATVEIELLNEKHEPLIYWTINNVWPRSWKVGELNAERGEVLIETLELNYNRLVFRSPGT